MHPGMVSRAAGRGMRSFSNINLTGGGGEVGERSRLTAPLLMAGVAPLPAIALHALATGILAMIIIIGLVLVASGIIAVSIWLSMRERSFEARIHALGTVFVASAWYILCTITGFITLRATDIAGMIPFRVPVIHHPAFELWLVGSLTAAVLYGVRTAQRERAIRDVEVGLEPPPREKQIDPWEVAGLGGTKGKMTQVNAFREEGIFELPPGSSLMDVQHRTTMLESARHWRPGSLQFVKAPEFKRADIVKGVHMLGDPLENAPIWPGLQIRRGMTIFNPIPVGIRSNGDPAAITFFSKEGGLHVLEVGMTGAGKTYGNKPALIYKAALGADIIVIDTQKSIQSFRDIAGVLKMYETNESRARAIIERLSTKTLLERTEYLAYKGLTEWQPGCGINPLFVHLEEAWSFTDMEEVEALAKALRSAGGHLTLSLQRGSNDQITPTLKSQLLIRRCYGVMDEDDALYALHEKVFDALGSRPDDWQNQTPGMQIVQQGDIANPTHAYPVRSYTDKGSDIKFADAALAVSRNMNEMCAVTAHSLGRLWDSHVDPKEIVNARGGELVAKPWGHVPDLGKTDKRAIDDGTDDADGVPDDDPDTIASDQEAIDRGADGDMDDVTDSLFGRFIEREASKGGNVWEEKFEDRPADRPEVMIGDQSKVSDEEFTRLATARLEELLDEGATKIEPADFADMLVESGHPMISLFNFLDHLMTVEGGNRLAKRDDGTIVSTD